MSAMVRNEKKLKGQCRGIMYQSRMRYLKSCDSGRKSKQKRTIGESSTCSKGSSFSASHNFSEKLLPPIELMTRERSFRRLLWKHHPPTMTVRKMDFLVKNEDPAVIKKRERIRSRIRAVELASDRQKREKEAWQRPEHRICGGDSVSLTNRSISDNSSSDDPQEIQQVHDKLKDTVSNSEDSFSIDVAGFVFESKKNSTKSNFSKSSQCTSAEIVRDDEDYIGDTFSFLVEWSKKGSRSKLEKE